MHEIYIQTSSENGSMKEEEKSAEVVIASELMQTSSLKVPGR
jgi:hypothetical protein